MDKIQPTDSAWIKKKRERDNESGNSIKAHWGHDGIEN